MPVSAPRTRRDCVVLILLEVVPSPPCRPAVRSATFPALNNHSASTLINTLEHHSKSQNQYAASIILIHENFCQRTQENLSRRLIVQHSPRSRALTGHRVCPSLEIRVHIFYPFEPFVRSDHFGDIPYAFSRSRALSTRSNSRHTIGTDSRTTPPLPHMWWTFMLLTLDDRS